MNKEGGTDQGLMPKILALIAPPVSATCPDAGKKRKLLDSAGYTSSSLFKPTKPKSRIDNNAFCDYCIEGGNLLCCDKCPATYHLKCNEPPLNEEDVPAGQWLCSKCSVIKEIRAFKEWKNNSSISQNKSKNPPTLPGKHIKLSINGINNQNYSISIKEDFQFSYKCRLVHALNKQNNPLTELAKVALILNPKEFELPSEYIPDILFPGSSKKVASVATRETRASAYSVRRAQELDRDACPLILRMCYYCKKGCRKAPLIHCDYCPLVFHADCIDPPLITLPNTLWMCPNHAEPIAEERLISSSSFCERVKLWNHFSRPIDAESIKISFLDKVNESFSNNYNDHNNTSTFGCVVPKQIKKEYAKFIKSPPSSSSSSEQSSPKSLNISDQIEPEEKESFSSFNQTLTNMIESSELLAKQDLSAPEKLTKVVKLNNISPKIHHLTSTDHNENNEDLQSKELVWLEFLQSLSTQKDGYSQQSIQVVPTIGGSTQTEGTS